MKNKENDNKYINNMMKLNKNECRRLKKIVIENKV